MSEKEPDETLVNQFQQMLAAVQQSRVIGHVSILFNASGELNIMLAGDQSMLIRLGALEIARDGVKVFAAQQEQAQKQTLVNMPVGGRA